MDLSLPLWLSVPHTVPHSYGIAAAADNVVKFGPLHNTVLLHDKLHADSALPAGDVMMLCSVSLTQ
jgi:hypothetical protein